MTTKQKLAQAQAELAALRAQTGKAPVPSDALRALMTETAAGHFPTVSPSDGQATVEPTNGASVEGTAGVTPAQSEEAKPARVRKPVVIGQPRVFLGSRTKFEPIPKRKPFVLPVDPAK